MATAMAATAVERAVLVSCGGRRPGRGRRTRTTDSGLSPQEEEFRWLLHDEVHAVLRQLQDILKVTLREWPRAFAQFPSLSGYGSFPTASRACLLRAPDVYGTRRIQTGPCPPPWTYLVRGASR